MSMNPGVTTCPATSIVRRVDSEMLKAIRTILSCRIATSARYQGLPVPSTTRAFLSNRSYGVCPAACVAHVRPQTPATLNEIKRRICRLWNESWRSLFSNGVDDMLDRADDHVGVLHRR